MTPGHPGGALGKSLRTECPQNIGSVQTVQILLLKLLCYWPLLAFFFLLLFLLLQEEKEGGALRRSAFRSATERSEALGAEMAAAQISIKSVFGHSQNIRPLAIRALVW